MNGKNLGRFWNTGPQRTLYLPADWLKKGHNQIVVFEEMPSKASYTLPFSKPWL